MQAAKKTRYSALAEFVRPDCFEEGRIASEGLLVKRFGDSVAGLAGAPPDGATRQGFEVVTPAALRSEQNLRVVVVG